MSVCVAELSIIEYNGIGEGVRELATTDATSSIVGVVSSIATFVSTSSFPCTSIGIYAPVANGDALMSPLAECIACSVHVLCLSISSGGASITKPEFDSTNDSIAITSTESAILSF